MFERGDGLVWKQVDRILADAHFKFLQKLEFGIWLFGDDDRLMDSKEYGPVCTSLVATFPLLLERGVSVEARSVRETY
jgi:hypothetical protein